MNLNYNNTSLIRVLDEIQNSSNYRFIYKIEDVDLNRSITTQKSDLTISEVLDELFANSRTTYNMVEDRIFLLPRQVNNNTTGKTDIPQLKIIGSVKDNEGNPLPGASVLIAGTRNGVVADLNGLYTIIAKPIDSLVFTYLGFKKQIVPVNAKMKIDVILLPLSEELDEIVLVGYGSQKKGNVTGSIGSVEVQELDRTNFTSAEQLLQGRTAGVQLSNVSGNPGGQQRVNIRGIGSLQGDNQPLYVIDGIPVSNIDPSQTPLAKFGQANLTNPLALINPNDIASIEILKDASAAAIYGSRATNGVILISTRKGSKQRTVVSLENYTGLQFMPEEINVTGTEDYLLVVNEARSNFNFDNNLLPGQTGYLEPVIDPREPGQKDTDWIGLITRDFAKVSNVGLSVNGGNDQTKLYFSLGYFDQEGIILTSRFQRLSANLNIEHKISPSITLTNNFIASYSLNNRVVSHGGIALLSDSREQRPFDTPFDEEGNYHVGGSPDLLRNNGVRGIQESDSDYRSYRLLNNTSLNIQLPIKGLSYTTSFGADVGLYHDRLFWSPDFRYAVGDGGQLTDSRNIAVKTVINNQIDYSREFGKFRINLTAVHAFEKFKIDRTFIEGTGFPFESAGSLATATSVRTSTFGTPPGVGNAIGENAIESYIARGVFEYDNRYLVNLAIRRDGSSQFAYGRKYGNFPSASGGWKFTNEKFFPKNFLINNGKVRVSWGETGSVSGVSDYASLPIVSGGFSYDGQQGALVTQTGNDLLSWERSTQFNYGLDLGLFNSKVQLSVDYFIKTTSDLLFDRPVVATSGFNTLTQNIGELENRGLEVEFFFKPVSNENFEWSLDTNISWIKNELISLPDNEDIVLGFAHILREGESIGSFYLLKQQGIYQTNEEVPATLFDQGVRAGDIIYEDVNDDGLINDADRQVVGNAFPDFFGGISSSLRYKHFDLTIFANFSVGNDVYANYRRRLDDLGILFNKRQEAVDNRWTGPGTSNSVPRAIANDTYNNLNSTRLLEDGSFLRLKTLTLGYTFPIKEEGMISKVRLFGTANNLFTLTNYSGLDPETSDTLDNDRFGIDQRSAPALRTFTLGFNLLF